MFSLDSFGMAVAVDNFSKLDFDDSTFFIDHNKVSKTFMNYGFIYKNCNVCDPLFNNLQQLLHINIDTLKSEMKVAKNYVLRFNQENVVNLNGIEKIISHEVYPNLFSLVKLALTVQVSSASCERTFSAMRRIKNWLSNSMVHYRFTDLSIIYMANIS